MKRWLPWLITGIFVLEILLALKGRPEKGLQTREFGKLPVLLNGRMQPLDSVARNSLLQIRGTQSVPLEGNAAGGKVWGDFMEIRAQGQLEERQWYQFTKHPKKLSATEWLLEVMLRPEQADERYIFLLHHPDLLNSLNLAGKGVERSGLHYFTYNELKESFPTIEKEGKRIREIEAALQTPLEKQTVKIENALMIYHRLKNSLLPQGTHDLAKEVDEFKAMVEPGVAAVRAREAGKEYDKELFDKFLDRLQAYDFLGRVSYPLMVPPPEPTQNRDGWVSFGANLFQSVKGGEISPAVGYYAAIASAYTHNEVEKFNTAVGQYREWLSGKFDKEVKKGQAEFFYNKFMAFYRSLVIYLMAALFGCAFWFNWSAWCRKTGYYLMFLAFVVHTFGLVFRMVLEGRPPVTNLYSSAIFIGWGAVVLGLILERFFKDGIGVTAASGLGFVTLIIAHNLALGGDTMEMLRAVLDTNFWLATHVTSITIGYSATFVAGFLAMVYILRGLLTRTLAESTAKALERMVYATVCFATLFSFVGTVLGGIWADQSWGRFWGWDPKENGALIIVIWNAAILHSRWGGMIKQRGLMNMAIFGNIVTAFSWFGVNMLGIGLHSYGFMDAAFKWLSLFVASQLFLIGLGLLPDRFWRSLRNPAPVPAPAA